MHTEKILKEATKKFDATHEKGSRKHEEHETKGVERMEHKLGLHSNEHY